MTRSPDQEDSMDQPENAQINVRYEPLGGVPVGPMHIRWPSGKGTRLTKAQALRLYHELGDAILEANLAEKEDA